MSDASPTPPASPAPSELPAFSHDMQEERPCIALLLLRRDGKRIFAECSGRARELPQAPPSPRLGVIVPSGEYQGYYIVPRTRVRFCDAGETIPTRQLKLVGSKA